MRAKPDRRAEDAEKAEEAHNRPAEGLIEYLYAVAALILGVLLLFK